MNIHLSLMACFCLDLCFSFRTLLAGGLGTLMLDRYGWESMFYSISFLSGLWALIVWQCLLKGTAVNHVFLNNKEA